MQEVLQLGAERLKDYQGERYAALYESRMEPFLKGDARQLAAEVARHLALWMAYEDIIRVADLKTRASRFERVRKEVGAKSGEPVVVIDYLKPGIEEFASVLPHFLGKRLVAWATSAREARRLQRRHAHPDFGRLRLPAGAQPRLAAPVAADELSLPGRAAADRALARATSPKRRGATWRWRSRSPSARGSSRATARRTAAARRNFLAIMDALVENPATADAREQAAAIRKAREAALADPEGQALGKTARQARRLAEARHVKSAVSGKNRSWLASPSPTSAPRGRTCTGRMDKHNLAPLWEVLHNLIPNEPVTPCKPALWKYRDARPYLMEAGKLITAKEAIRRVLILREPRACAASRASRKACIAGLQLILPGEVAPSHRHSQSALRFIVEGSGAYTAVDGERTTMRPGDFIITPSWTWHDHGNPGNDPVVWMDGLDIRIVQTFAAQFHEVFPEEVQPVSRSEGASVARFGSGLAPLGASAPFGKTSPIFNYPVRAQPRVAGQARAGPGSRSVPRLEDGVHQPADRRARHADHRRVHPAAAEGLQARSPTAAPTARCTRWSRARARRVIGGETLRLRAARHLRRALLDPLELEAKGETVLFSFSDRPGQEAMGLWREKRG